jgi:hypothetical protein
VLGNNARSCASFGYSQLAFDHIAGSDPERLAIVNEHAAFWNGVRGGMQTAMFVALGRIFDTTKGTDNARDLLRYADTYQGIFSESTLAARKVRQGLDPTFAAQYASEAFKLPRNGLQPLMEALEANRTFYEANVEQIRHTVFAHSGRLSLAERDALFTGLTVRELEKLVVFPLRLHRALQQLFDNGMEPVLQDAPTNVVEIHGTPLGTGVNTWEHRHVVDAVAKLLGSLKPTDN